jgi:hypothetical protein
MAKQKSSGGNASNNPGSELIVVVSPDAGLRATPDAVASTSGKKVASLNSLLKNYEASFSPIFGSESRLGNMPEASLAALESVGVNPATYYCVLCKGDQEAMAKALIGEGLVTAAYLKPAPEAPVMLDENLDFTTIASGDAPPATPDFTARQGYLDASPGGIDARFAWGLSGGKGNGVRIIDIEGAWRFTHEDLLLNQGGVIGGTQSTDIAWRNHGTAVAGEISGDENAFGITGICPNANIRAISIFGGLGSANAIINAANALSAGDIILIELHRPGPRFAFASRTDQRGYIAVEWWPDDFAAIRYAISRGVIVVEAAGNGAENLDDAIYNTRPGGFPATWRNPFNTANPSSNAVVVGAGAPPPGTHGRNHGADRSRLDFSNWGARVDAQGWGREVTTCGYGGLQGGANEDLWYTDTFSGTSSASPIVVGALGCIQGRLRARSRPLLTPATAINLLRTTGSPQQNEPTRPATQRIGNRPNLRQALTTLGVQGPDIKLKEVVKEAIGDKSPKEFIKEVKEKDAKEVVDKNPKELVKELKEKDAKEFKEFKEGKEFKEKDKDVFEGGFGKGGVILGGPQQQTGDGGVEQRLGQLEQTVQQLAHFISGEMRPDLHTPLYQAESAEQQSLMKNAADAKQMKDSKDMEKTREF